MNRPEVRYALSGDGYVAYQVIGEGPIDLVFHAGWNSHLDLQWDFPELVQFLEGLASFSRLIVFDRRGHGLSDPIDLDSISLEDWMEDTSAVMDAASSERAMVVATAEAVPAQILFAASHPSRTAGLVLINGMACGARRLDYPAGPPEHVQEAVIEQMSEFVRGVSDETFAGIAPDAHRYREWHRRLLRASAGPTMATQLFAHTIQEDVRSALPLVQVPTLVIQQTDQPFVRVANGRYLAEHIAGSRFVELEGSALYPWLGDQRAVLAEIEEFVTGARPVQDVDRVLSTVLFADIVGSTEQASRFGDSRWRDVLGRIDNVVRRELDRSRGRFVKDRGDGFFATFDGPARAVRCAKDIVAALRSIDIALRVGLHTGEVELDGDDVRGIAVHIGARVADLASSSEVLVSRTVTDLVAGSGLTFSDRGSFELKGVPGRWQLYAADQ